MEEQEQDIIAKDLPLLHRSVIDLKEVTNDLSQFINNALEMVKSGSLKTADGISLLDVKYHALLQYIADIVGLVSCKVHGEEISGKDFVVRTVENRTVLEKIRPLEKKLQYQIDKVLQMTEIPEGNPLSFKPNLDNLDASESSADEPDGSDGNVEDDGTSKKYVPPHIAAVKYEEDSKQDRINEKERERALKRSSMMAELMQDLTDSPVEISHQSTVRNKVVRVREERKKFEEDYMTRINVSKKQRNAERNNLRKSELDSLTIFGNDFLYNDKSKDSKLDTGKKLAKRVKKRRKK